MRISLFLLPLILLPSSAWAQAKPGTVLANGKVTINDKAVEHSGNIFAGETLKTASNGAASITSEGALAAVGNSTSLIYGDNAVNVECGRVQVVTLKGFTVQVHKITASAGSGLTKFEVTQNARRLSIHDLEGQLEIQDGDQRSTLNPGEKRDFQSPAACAAAADPISPLVPATIFGASTFPIWLDYDNFKGRPITPVKP